MYVLDGELGKSRLIDLTQEDKPIGMFVRKTRIRGYNTDLFLHHQRDKFCDDKRWLYELEEVVVSLH
jgi:hypothetical protein